MKELYSEIDFLEQILNFATPDKYTQYACFRDRQGTSTWFGNANILRYGFWGLLHKVRRLHGMSDNNAIFANTIRAIRQCLLNRNLNMFSYTHDANKILICQFTDKRDYYDMTKLLKETMTLLKTEKDKTSELCNIIGPGYHTEDLLTGN